MKTIATNIITSLIRDHLRILLGVVFSGLITLALLIWNLSMIGDVFASPAEDESVEALKQEISRYESQLNVTRDGEETLAPNLPELIQSLPTKFGVVIERLNRRERVHRRETVKLLEVDLEGSYQSIANALRYIERSPVTEVDQLSVKQSADNQRSVKLTLTLEDKQA